MYQEYLPAEKEDLEGQTNMLESIAPRVNFVRKVYIILSIQLLLTGIVCTFVMNYKNMRQFLISEAGLTLLWVCLAYSIVAGITLVCYRTLARSVPTNYIILFTWTLAEAYLIGFVCAFSDPKIVVMAVFMTAGIVISLTVYAFTTKNDFTIYGGMLFIFLAAFILFGIFLLFTNNETLHVFYSACGVILFGFYLIYDTQLIAGGGKYELDMDDYIIGALMLYIDIVQIFLHLLKILQSSRG